MRIPITWLNFLVRFPGILKVLTDTREYETVSCDFKDKFIVFAYMQRFNH